MTIKIAGNWVKGFAYDIHTLDSAYLGTDEHERDRFDTTYSEMGELVRRLKYKGDKTATSKIVDLLGKFQRIKIFDAIIPAPSSKKDRRYQPVDEIALELGKRTGVPVFIGGLLKIAGGKELKNMDDYDERIAELKKTITLSDEIDVAGKKVLLLDDLYQSGATLTVSTEILYEHGGADTVSVLAMTKTRIKR